MFYSISFIKQNFSFLLFFPISAVFLSQFTLNSLVSAQAKTQYKQKLGRRKSSSEAPLFLSFHPTRQSLGKIQALSPPIITPSQHLFSSHFFFCRLYHICISLCGVRFEASRSRFYAVVTCRKFNMFVKGCCVHNLTSLLFTKCHQALKMVQYVVGSIISKFTRFKEVCHTRTCWWVKGKKIRY